MCAIIGVVALVLVISAVVTGLLRQDRSARGQLRALYASFSSLMSEIRELDLR
ncbi:MAG: hypothetical protein ACLP8S_03530 [Solirubrobacteraceae bacterium]